MKKLITIILILAMLLPTIVSAEGLLTKSIDELTFEELIRLNEQVQKKLFETEALISGVKIPSGVYIVGQDIPAGSYRVEFRNITGFDHVSFMASNQKEVSGYYTILGYTGASEIGKIDLTNETEVTISGGDVYFYTYTGLFN